MIIATSSTRNLNPPSLVWHIILAASSTRILNPRSLSYMAFYDVASIVCQALP